MERRDSVAAAGGEVKRRSHAKSRRRDVKRKIEEVRRREAIVAMAEDMAAIAARECLFHACFLRRIAKPIRKSQTVLIFSATPRRCRRRRRRFVVAPRHYARLMPPRAKDATPALFFVARNMLFFMPLPPRDERRALPSFRRVARATTACYHAALYCRYATALPWRAQTAHTCPQSEELR